MVTQDGPADGKLMVGDWIRSIDGQALVNPNEVGSSEKCSLLNVEYNGNCMESYIVYLEMIIFA